MIKPSLWQNVFLRSLPLTRTAAARHSLTGNNVECKLTLAQTKSAPIIPANSSSPAPLPRLPKMPPETLKTAQQRKMSPTDESAARAEILARACGDSAPIPPDQFSTWPPLGAEI